MPATGYIIEHDKSGRASCKGACKQKIEKGALRFGSCSTAAWDGEQTHFRKLTCMTKKVAQNALDFYGGDITQLRNWATLSADEQAEVKEVFDSFIASAEPPKKKAAKKKKEDDDEEDSAPPKKVKKAAPKKKAAPAVAMPGDDD